MWRAPFLGLVLWTHTASSASIPDTEIECGITGKVLKKKLQKIRPTTIRAKCGTISPGKSPWYVTLVDELPDKTYKLLCGGSVLTKDFVLTARHCFECERYAHNSSACLNNLMPANSNDKVEEYYTGSEMQAGYECENQGRGRGFKCEAYFESKAIFIQRDAANPNYASKYHDVALMQLSESIQYGEHMLAPICIPDTALAATFRNPNNNHGLYNQNRCQVSGKGVDSTGGNSGEQLKLGKVLMYEADQCDVLKHKFDGSRRDIKRMFTREYICVKPNLEHPRGGGACGGNSGGALTCRHGRNFFQMALVSEGEMCDGEDLYSDVTSITTRTWIQEVTGGYQVKPKHGKVFWETPQKQCQREWIKSCKAGGDNKAYTQYQEEKEILSQKHKQEVDTLKQEIAKLMSRLETCIA